MWQAHRDASLRAKAPGSIPWTASTGSCSAGWPSDSRALLNALPLSSAASHVAMGSAASSLKALAAAASEAELTEALQKLEATELAKLKAALGRQVVVVGWGPVGHQVVSKLLAKGQGGVQITVISEVTGWVGLKWGQESYPAYNRVKLSSFFEHRDPNKLALSSLSP